MIYDFRSDFFLLFDELSLSRCLAVYVAEILKDFAFWFGIRACDLVCCFHKQSICIFFMRKWQSKIVSV